MKIFGFEISRPVQAKDQIVVRSVTPSSTPISKIPRVGNAVYNFAQMFARGRGNFTGAEYDLSEIGKIEDTDGFVRQAFKKKMGLMFKEGVGYQGSDKQTIQYLKTRLAQIARASNIPTADLLKRIAHSLIRTSNAFLVKARNQKASGGKSRVDATGKTLEPIAAYFPVAPETMRFDMDQETGEIVKWKQVLPDGKQTKEFSPDDVIHFVIDRREGFIFGVPHIIPVIDDIRALRQIEENIELLLYQNLFPLFQYIVGTETAPAAYAEDGTSEIQMVQDQIRLMPSEGFIVTPERHEIRAVGSEGRALRAEGYLDHFKKRVFAGLGVSSVDMGDGDTTNRGTAQTLSRQLIDAVKDIQDALETQFDHYIIAELLMESTFGDRVLDEEHMVHLQFAEIDIQNRIDQEKHAAELFKANGLTYDEFRSLLRREPILVPIEADDQDPTKYPEWFQTHWKLIEEPTNLIRAVDEPYSAAAQAAAEARSLSMTTKQLQAEQEGRDNELATAAEEDRKTKIAVAKNRPRPTRDNFLESSFSDLESDTIDRIIVSINTRGRLDSDSLRSMARIWSTDASTKLQSLAIAEMTSGFNNITGHRSFEAGMLLGIARSEINDRINYRMEKLINDIIALISHRVDSIGRNVKLSEALKEVSQEAYAVFGAVKFRIGFIWDVELRKAYNYGQVLGIRFLGGSAIKLVVDNDACESCRALSNKTIPVASLTLDDVPPLHPHSRMQIEAILVSDATRNVDVPARKPGSSAVEQPEETEDITAVCPDCGKTAMWQFRSGNFYCHSCQATFDDDSIDDATKLERCVLRVKGQLRKKNPGMSEDEIKSGAYAICNASLNKK